jgi:hypothetical protein
MVKKFIKYYGYPICIKRWITFLSSRALFWKQTGLFTELGSAAQYLWVKVDLQIFYDEGDYYNKKGVKD